jgi:SAM-dependent methyltransferase
MIQRPEIGGGGELPFGEYAAVYDLIYQDKDYSAEVDFVVDLISRFSNRPPASTSLLDLACGTGRHALEFARRGFSVDASDISPDMVRIASGSAAAKGLQVQFHNHSFQTSSAISKKFDAVLAMFAALGYLTTSDEFDLACRNVASLLKPGGLFIFDVWNGHAVVRDYSPHRTKRVVGGGLSVERESSTKLDEIRQIADVRFDFSVAKENGATSCFSERHLVRFFYPDQLSERLADAGFEVLLRCPFLAPARELTPKDWNMTFVARLRP